MSTRLRTLLDSLDELPEAIDPRDLYSEGSGADAGRYVLDLEPVEGLELARTGKLAQALDKERKGNRGRRGEVVKLQETIEDLQERLEAYEESGDGGHAEALTKERRAFETKLASAQQAAQQQLEAAAAERDRYRDRYRQETVDRSIAEALTQGDVRGPVKLLAPIFRQHARWDTDDEGNDVMTVMDMDGEVPLMKAGQPGGFRDLAQRYANDPEFAEVLRQPTPSGGGRSGAPNTAPGRSGQRVYRASLDEARDFSQWTALEDRAAAGEFELQPPSMGEG